MNASLLDLYRRTDDTTIMAGTDSRVQLNSGRGTEMPSGTVLGRMGTLEVRLAETAGEISAAQELRFKVFFSELGARQVDIHALEQRDADRFDALCDHLLVFDTSIAGPQVKQIVGTYRLMRREQADRAGGFYSASEFDVEDLLAAKPELSFLELGRSCVLPAYRSKRTVELLWQGIWAYCRRHSVQAMFGCASFHGTVPAAHALSLSFLHHYCRVDAEWHVAALPERYQPMDMMPKEAINPKVALFGMPPLIKGYLRLGAMIGDGAVIDQEFGTTDVFIMLPVERISSRYINYYGTDADRFV